MNLRYLGTPLRLRPGARPRRLPRPQPVTREKRYWFNWGRLRFHLAWQPYVGLFFTSASDPGTGREVSAYLCPLKTERIVKRVVLASVMEAIKPALPWESKTLSKFPTFSHFMTDTTYDDGTPRTPGRWWWNNLSTTFEVILFNPDAGARLPVVAPTIDEMFAALEMITKAENAPWQPDKFLQEQLAKKSRKK